MYTCENTLIILSINGTQAHVVCVLKAPPVRDDHTYCLLLVAFSGVLFCFCLTLPAKNLAQSVY